MKNILLDEGNENEGFTFLFKLQASKEGPYVYVAMGDHEKGRARRGTGTSFVQHPGRRIDIYIIDLSGNP